MNRITLMGRFTRDPEVRYTGADNLAVARFSIAVNRRFKKEGQPEADYFNCTAFRKLASDVIEKYCHKGMKVLIEGELQQDNYTAKDGSKVYGYNVIVNNLEFAESKNASSQGAAAPEASTATPASNGPAPGGGDDFMSVPDSVVESLPFN